MVIHAHDKTFLFMRRFMLYVDAGHWNRWILVLVVYSINNSPSFVFGCPQSVCITCLSAVHFRCLFLYCLRCQEVENWLQFSRLNFRNVLKCLW